MRLVFIRGAPAEFSATVFVAVSSTTAPISPIALLPKVKAVLSENDPPAVQPASQFTCSGRAEESPVGIVFVPSVTFTGQAPGRLAAVPWFALVDVSVTACALGKATFIGLPPVPRSVPLASYSVAILRALVVMLARAVAFAVPLV